MDQQLIYIAAAESSQALIKIMPSNSTRWKKVVSTHKFGMQLLLEYLITNRSFYEKSEKQICSSLLYCPQWIK